MANQVFHGSSGLDNLLRASVTSAAFDSIERHPAPACLPGTRLELLARLAEWADNPATDQRVCWLSGVAGSGKSLLLLEEGNIAQDGPKAVSNALASQMLVFAPSIKPAIIDVP
ncbi:hypothetical protein BU15DRAFT_78536 [Melanogaster broomeanus]|nr:hypothetical protein BU15DRAFT_78536 [Melanogaster broomeanus]